MRKREKLLRDQIKDTEGLEKLQERAWQRLRRAQNRCTGEADPKRCGACNSAGQGVLNLERLLERRRH